MCKLMDDFKNEILDDFRNEITEKVAKEVTERVSKETAILTTVDTARRYGASESAILADIMGQFDLSESEARSYMLKKSA